MFISLTYPFIVIAAIVSLALGINNSQMNHGYDGKLENIRKEIRELRKETNNNAEMCFSLLPKACLVRNSWGNMRYLDQCKKKLKSEIIIFERE